MVEAVLDLAGTRSVHVANVGGAGMSAVATLLAEMGHRVRGHDPNPASPFVAPLRGAGVEVIDGPAVTLADGVDAVIVSTATPEDDPVAAAARERGVPVLHRSVALRAMSAVRATVAVAGTHGKTTTSAMLATVLQRAGYEPGWIIGAPVPSLGRSAAWGSGQVLVVEADESDGTFLELDAHDAIVTSVEPDHLEHYGSASELSAAFERFAAGVRGACVLCIDDPGAARLRAAAGAAVTYGSSAGADYRLSGVVPHGDGVRFDLHHAGDRVEVELPAAPGAHNATNATGAVALAHELGVPLVQAAEALRSFRGVARRFERRGIVAGITFVDDYAHLPAEVAAVLAAARAGGWRRVVCAFQPHRFSRTESLGASFADAFAGADVLCLTDVYAAGERSRPGVSGRLLLEAVLDAHPWSRVAYLPRLDDVVRYLLAELREGDLCLTLGAGDLTTVPDRAMAALGERS